MLIVWTILSVIIMLCILALPILVLALMLVSLRTAWRKTSSGDSAKRLAIIAAGFLVIASPYLAYKGIQELLDRREHNILLALVPEPLQVEEIEYRVEDYFGGIGLPGDNETGFIVFRLTKDSAEWARRQGSALVRLLPGGSEKWHPTPVDDTRPGARWHYKRTDVGAPAHPPTVAEYLDHYGYQIQVEGWRIAEADHAIQTRGSFYSYRQGGLVIIIDPSRGKAYVLFAG